MSGIYVTDVAPSRGGRTIRRRHGALGRTWPDAPAGFNMYRPQTMRRVSLASSLRHRSLYDESDGETMFTFTAVCSS